MESNNKLLVVCGPTATGKTAVALDLAKQLNGELVSADSRQVYIGMDIATGKDTPTDGTTIWMYDVAAPDEAFSVAQYREQAATIITDILQRGKLPIVVGGTGLYIKSLIDPIETASIPPNQQLRGELAALSLEELQKRLQKEDPKTWESLHTSDRQNARRLIRKIEIAHFSSGNSLRSTIPASPAGRHDLPSYDIFQIGMTAPNEVLYKRIDERVEERIKQGVEQEIQTLLARGYTWDLPSMNTLGYKEFQHGFTPEAIQTWKYNEHAYARRQKTWFAREQAIHWYDITRDGWKQQIHDDVISWYGS